MPNKITTQKKILEKLFPGESLEEGVVIFGGLEKKNEDDKLIYIAIINNEGEFHYYRVKIRGQVSKE
ncbi:hypothetical protein A3I25_02005 [Candidatus Nomurabacteria bacterium RIFCSPLOWO2_02_FULL_42_17]|uniref:Uncharacterized protein n=2 Tax=Candidatus Nomuraibacteriota TaxID=1752729 RepID=A0A1F6WHL3_9BACT|nr:MAG: hypothetical protein UV08_C0019G0007 [Parcubacteria group bacterium GW2011_GWA2_42_18]OGI81391.1 MAG: hypothetical protein A3B93_01660 [Candidatus Nomurabacteria bacterium RIFCSPHIGHO2_02_FULL_42_24]OGI97550.1 MAG: hypothetical protein A3I25_02005 [Candidatus Nomurabacteria bacterium RIFCSPLOWO2_02_FULL_42_17]